MKCLKIKTITAAEFLTAFFKWMMISILIGAAGGAAGILFQICLNWATAFRNTNGFTLWFLPVGGLGIVALYKLTGLQGKGTDSVLKAVRNKEKLPALLAPIIFASTVATHLLGGSAGREGAALQMGGSIASQMGRILALDKNDNRIIIMSGMGAVFAALFGTPITAAFFAIEISSVGTMHYSALIPCMVAAFTAYGIAGCFGVQPVRFTLSAVPEMSVLNLVRASFLAALCAVISILFCLAMKYTGRLLNRLFKNEYIKIAAGGVIIVALTLLCGTRDYNGAGIDVISRAISGRAVAWAFILKIIFTAITIESGYKGGEIVPAFFVGATFGCVAGNILGINPGFAAALGMTAVFCGVVNCPVASIMLGIEVFGGKAVGFFALSCAICFMLSGYFGLYGAQKFVFSKINTEVININAK